MVTGSVSILSPTSSFPDSLSSSISLIRPLNRKPFKIQALLNQPVASSDNNGGAKLFLENNSIADFMRFKKGDRDSNGELQTAVVTYKKKFPWSLLQPFLQVDLVSTIHIADKEYFDILQKELESYDCVLYEMVASKESLENRRIASNTKRLKSSRSKGFNILGCIQRQMASVLALDFQLDCLDYQSQNWYHADLDFETFKALQDEKGESLFSFAREMTLKSTKAMVEAVSIPSDLGPWKSKLLWASRVLPMPLIGLVIIGSVCTDTQKEESEYSELQALSRLDFGGAMKIFLAKRLTSEFSQVTAEVEEKSVIIGERNRVATEAIRRSISEGKNKIAVLYGGGHMPDLGRRLREEFDLVPSRVEWVTAWSIRNQETESGSSFPLLKTMADLSGWPLNRYQTLALVIFSSVLAVDLLFWELFFGTAFDWVSQAALDVKL
ncbi:hypothetical protein ACHQM5_002227 [Ranunculus cassubicifolius]